MAANSADRLPRALDCSDLAKEWPIWKQQFHIFMIANNKINEDERNKIAIFLWLVGDHGVEIYNTLFPSNGDMKAMFGEIVETNTKKDDKGDAAKKEEKGRTLDDVITAFDSYCLPRKNLAIEAFKFNLIEQKENQPFAEFETALRKQMAFCEFECANCHASYADRMLRDRIIVGIQNKTLQLKLLDAKDEPLKNVVEMCKTYEAASKHKQLIQTNDVHHLNSVEKDAGNWKIDTIQRSELHKASCYNCGQPFNGSHRRYCPAKNVTCNNCGKRGHFMKFCKAPKINSNSDISREPVRTTHEVKQRNDKDVNMIAWADSE
ncbi:uncharacterized protein LOC120900350 [Anopheles arabiensis]|uniref:uncharacterized protein LOC120900350 n=1 Tax=Anopheles arabiensis TaxID=7173 RepID=UPI001AAC621B|nr:uncharacterized protein LOC120900350 [Anopheles arabiensis]